MRFDEIETGVATVVGSHDFPLGEILRFARAFDPQPFHVDEAAGRESHFGGLIASGWHTASAWMRLTVDHALSRGTLAGISPGLEELSWLKPVFPGDSVRFANTVVEKRRLASRQGWALITVEAEGVNQHGDVVFRLRGPAFVPIDD